MGMIALLIILVVLVGAIRRGMTDSALPEPGKPPTDKQNPFNPGGAPLTVADAMEPSHPPADMVALRRLGSAMEGLGAVLPLGNQGATREHERATHGVRVQTDGPGGSVRPRRADTSCLAVSDATAASRQ